MHDRSKANKENLRSRIDALEILLADLKQNLAESSLTPADCTNQDKAGSVNSDTSRGPPKASSANDDWRWPLDAEEYKRYGRQMIMPEIGLKGQMKLKNASVLIVGAGGLGCPAASYLAGAGIGILGLVDGDMIETSNLHRQILHTSDRIGCLKVTSAIDGLRQHNAKVQYRAHPSYLEPTTALDIIDQYSLILDCTDRPTSRYLISDAAVIAGKPLISASALRTEGQLLVLNNPPRSAGKDDGGFCYRCVFPKPTPADSVMSCGEGGILGPVVGVMGVLMAVEAIKIITASSPPVTQIYPQTSASLLLYSAYTSPPFRSMRLRGKRPACPSCSGSATISRHTLSSGSFDYSSFCMLSAPATAIIPSDARISAQDYKENIQTPGIAHTLIDVREPPQFELCHLEHSINIPFSQFSSSAYPDKLENSMLRQLLDNAHAYKGPIYLVCRFGNDSQLAVQALRSLPEFASPEARAVKDIRGGLEAWRREVDPRFPEY